MNKKVAVSILSSLIFISFNAYADNSMLLNSNKNNTQDKTSNTSLQKINKNDENTKIDTMNNVPSNNIIKPSVDKKLKNNSKFYTVKIYYNSRIIAAFNAGVKGDNGWKGSYDVTRKYKYKEKLRKAIEYKYADFYKISISLHDLPNNFVNIDFATYKPSSIEKFKKNGYTYNIVRFKKFDIDKKIKLLKYKGANIKFNNSDVSISRS